MNSEEIKNSNLGVFAEKFATIKLNKEKSNIKEDNDKVFVYIGNQKKIFLSVIFEKGKNLQGMKLYVNTSARDFATIISTASQVVENGEIEIDLSPQTIFESRKIIIRATLPFYKDATCEVEVKCKDKKNPPVNLSFAPNKNVRDNKMVIYKDRSTINKDHSTVKIGELTVECLDKENGQRIPKPENYKVIDLANDIIIKSENTQIFFLQPQKGNDKKDAKKEYLVLGESVVFDVMAELNENTETRVYNLSFECLTKKCTDVPKIIIKDKEAEDLPDFDFKPSSDIVYPIDRSKIQVGSLSITLPQAKNGRYKRENGCILFDNDSCFYFVDEKRSCFTKQWAVAETEKPICIYFDAFNYFHRVENISEQSILINLPLKYKDDNVDKEPISVDVKNGNFTICQYEALPDLSMILVDSKECEYQVTFDESNNAEVRVSNEVRYTQAMSGLPAGKRFTLKLMNRQKICIPDNSVKLSEIKSDKDFIIIDSRDQYCIHNGGKEESLVIKIDWGRLTGECSCFTITGKLNDRSFAIKVFCSIYETITTNWRSLDLGTSAIVLAEMHRDDIKAVIETINLSDAERSLEPHKDMISSTIVLYKEEGNDYHDLILSPERMKYNKATAILPAVKFLVGQTKLPFLDLFQNRGVSNLRGKYLETVELNENLSPEAIIESIYKDIFSRMGENAQDETKKLILTYPSTYTIEQRNKLKELVLNEFKNLQKQNLEFVAESDAVLAQYLYSKRTSVGGSPLQNGEKILIYDMGAGTLDISYVRIEIENEGTKKQFTKAIVEKRIGIPVAGNYLDYCIFKYLEPYITEEALGKPQTLKKNIQELKSIISEGTADDGTIQGNVTNIGLTDEAATIAYQEIIESEPLTEFFKKCSEGVFELLLGNNWMDEKVTFVYSGRGCLFKPLINHIKDLSGWTPEPIADSPEEMKLCAARGAIRYVEKFSKDSQEPFVIESFKYYASFGLVYLSYNQDGTETYKCEMLKSADEIETMTEENFHSFIPAIDIRPNGPLILVQSYLNSNRISESFNHRWKNEPDDDRCYISEIFRVYHKDLGMEDANLQEASVDFTIDDFNDTIKFEIMGQPLNEHKRTENIENDVNYRNSMWPFNN